MLKPESQALVSGGKKGHSSGGAMSVDNITRLCASDWPHRAPTRTEPLLTQLTRQVSQRLALKIACK